MTRLTAFAIVASTTLLWLLAGFSVGGTAAVLERTISLIRQSATYHRLKTALLT
jgi:hypothetical protein